ncbi:threonine--tRNA ligase [Amygdalobacter nucleatus]|uniref:Threonine--tRNA ligase n=2 Tax=Amygdalobacter nucleatus TaxID=3029274 RepID=A0A133YCH1_9FIRM|nr:threonine--tRNA ligase [Amygdalobacter nucleatus]
MCENKQTDDSLEVKGASQAEIDKIHDDAEYMQHFWHTTSHILAQAVKRLYPETKLAIGPSIKNGFYYDLDREEKFTDEDLAKLEKEMKQIVKQNYRLERIEMSREEAIKYWQDRNEPYKVELIQDMPEDTLITFYKQGEFVDLCRGGHLDCTGRIKAFKLTSIAGAYWRGDEKNKMLTRIYGISFPKKETLKAYLQKLEEAKQRDHRRIGREMNIFMTSDMGPGFPFWLPNGVKIKECLKQLLIDNQKRMHYQQIETPIILSRQLWETSGHWAHYQEKMYTTEIDGETFAVKPMNCPGGVLVYRSQPRSYRDLPLRLSEFGHCHRHEQSGELHGLMRVRSFTQDDAHIFMTAEQAEAELENVISLIDRIYKRFGFKYHVELSTRPEDSMGSDKDWELATNALESALKKRHMEYVVNPGDGAFYGPKIDFHIEDALGREWQCGTAQIDFQLPERFQLEYIGSDNEKHRPIMLHRAIYGSLERFIAVLIEHYAGKFPYWLAPEQVRILPISEKVADYAHELESALFDADVRVQVDWRNEKIGYKIRQAQLDHVPYMFVVGEKEANNKQVAVRSRDEGDKGVMSLEDFLASVK